jgi:2-polyprenyl-3-methyl-5-hydroxy-6-metoxy-1,4-benzoquinol methylase
MTLQRDRQPEQMDAPNLPQDEHLRALAGLARLNFISGVARAMYRHLRRHAVAQGDRPLHVLDVASGGGDVPVAWAARAKREGLPMQFTLLDVSGVAVEEQQRRARARDVEVLSLQHDCLSSPLPAGFDVVTCSLFMHHLDDHQAFKLLQAMQVATDGGLVVCDLERSRFNLALVTIGSRLLTRSPVVHHDASLSVRAAYTMDEFQRLAESALARPVRIQRSFPCRFVAMFDEETVSEAVPAFA